MKAIAIIWDGDLPQQLAAIIEYLDVVAMDEALERHT